MMPSIIHTSVAPFRLILVQTCTLVGCLARGFEIKNPLFEIGA